MYIRRYLFLLMFLTFILLGACARISPTVEPTLPTTVSPAIVNGTSWQLIEAVTPQGADFSGLDLRLITLVFQDGSTSGSSGCNRYFTEYIQQGGRIDFSDQIGATKMACPEIQMNLESTFFAFLNAVETLSIEDQRLILSGAGYAFTFETTK